MKSFLLATMLSLVAIAITPLNADDNLLAMTYAGPGQVEIELAVAGLQKDVSELKSEMASLKSTVASLQSADSPLCKCENCKCEDCPGDCLRSKVELEVPEIEFKDPKPLGRTATLNGKIIDVDDYIARHGGRSAPHWSIHGHQNIANVHSHLRDHGFSDFEQLDKSTLMALHQARHHDGGGIASSVRTSIPVVKIQPSSRNAGCANGNCSRPRSRLFPRWR